MASASAWATRSTAGSGGWGWGGGSTAGSSAGGGGGAGAGGVAFGLGDEVDGRLGGLGLGGGFDDRFLGGLVEEGLPVRDHGQGSAVTVHLGRAGRHGGSASFRVVIQAVLRRAGSQRRRLGSGPGSAAGVLAGPGGLGRARQAVACFCAQSRALRSPLPLFWKSV